MSRLSYYLSSIPTLLGGIRSPAAAASLAIGRGPAVLRFSSGLRLKVRGPMDVWIAKETCLDRQYEAFGAPIQDGWTVIDIGAGLGDFAVMVAREHPAARVFAFEPFGDSYALLEENIRLNNVTNVVARPVAVGAATGELVLATTGESVQHTTTGSTRQGVGSAQLRVQSLSLGDLLDSHGIAHCDFMKMDCEGAEYDIFFSAPAEALARIRRICLEYHDGFTGHSHADLERFLSGHGFRVKSERNPVHDYIGLMYAARP